MKRTLRLLLAALGCATPGLAQQLPNGNLETWATTATGDRAENWLTMDDLILANTGFPVSTGTTTKTTDAHTGSFAAKLETKEVTPIGNFPGYLILGTQVNTLGLPFVGRPATMQLHYKLSGPNVAADSAIAGVLLSRTVGGQRQVVAEGVTVLPAAGSYTLRTVALQYQSALLPDSVYILICSGMSKALTAGTALHVDDIALTGTATPTRPDAAAPSLTLHPNPSPDGRFLLEAPQEPALLGAELTVSNYLGQTVLTQAATPLRPASREVDLRGQPAGVYVLRLDSGQGAVVRRLTIR